MKYKNHFIVKTNLTTSVHVRANFGSYEKTVALYEIQGKAEKPASVRPFITSVKAAKEYINQEGK